MPTVNSYLLICDVGLGLVDGWVGRSGCVGKWVDMGDPRAIWAIWALSDRPSDESSYGKHTWWAEVVV